MTDGNEDMKKAGKIVKELADGVYTAIWYASFYKRVTIKGEADDICQAFGPSYGNGVKTCQYAFLDALILAISRIIWGSGKNTASLEALCDLLEKYKVMKQFSEADLRDAEKLVEDVRKDLGNDKCASLKKYRNTQLAHQTINSNPQKGKGQKKAEYGDPLDILDMVIPKVKGFLDLFKDSSDFKYVIEETEKIADKFWKYAARIDNIGLDRLDIPNCDPGLEKDKSD